MTEKTSVIDISVSNKFVISEMIKLYQMLLECLEAGNNELAKGLLKEFIIKLQETYDRED